MLPFIVLEDLEENLIEKWNKGFLETGRNYSHGMWFRTQEMLNRKFSGWSGPDDRRRRLIQFYDEYEIENNNLCITNCYLWISLAFPEEEIKRYMEHIKMSAEKGSWRMKNKNTYEKGDILLKFKLNDCLREDRKQNREFPKNYRFLTVTFKSKGYRIPGKITKLPWKLFNQGIRKQEKRGHPEYIKDISVLKKFLPAYLELGCGLSIEAGIDPLYSYHSLYSVQDHKTKKFFLSPEEDYILYEFLENTEMYFEKVSEMYKKMLLAKPTKLHCVIKELIQKGLIIEPILNNNFDGLCEELGLNAVFIRDYVKHFRFKKYRFDKRAKSYWVVGCHADRRLLQGLARKAGLKVIYIDPEYFLENGEKRYYPLEGPKDDDIVINMTGNEFADKLKTTF